MSEELESLGLVAYNYEPEFTEEEMRNITTETPINDEPVSLEEWCSCNECEEMPRYDNVTLSPLLLPAKVTNRSHSRYGSSTRSDSHGRFVVLIPL